MTLQPDLFGELEAEEAAAANRERNRNQPYTCPACGTTEPNSFLLRNNHGYRVDEDTGTIHSPGGYLLGQHGIYGRKCLAQHLVRNHITFFTQNPNNENQLERAKTRGRELGLDVDAIEALARQEASP